MDIVDFSVGFVWCNGRAHLGHGTFGAVRRAKQVTSGNTVAVKTFSGTDARAAALSEAVFLKRLDNPLVVRCIELAAEGQNILLVMEHCILGTLEALNASWGHAMPFDIAAHLGLPSHLRSIPHNLSACVCWVCNGVGSFPARTQCLQVQMFVGIRYVHQKAHRQINARARESGVRRGPSHTEHVYTVALVHAAASQ